MQLGAAADDGITTRLRTNAREREIDTYPVPPHHTLPEPPFAPHLTREDAQAFVGLVPVLALHADLKHFD